MVSSSGLTRPSSFVTPSPIRRQVVPSSSSSETVTPRAGLPLLVSRMWVLIHIVQAPFEMSHFSIRSRVIRACSIAAFSSSAFLVPRSRVSSSSSSCGADFPVAQTM